MKIMIVEDHREMSHILSIMVTYSLEGNVEIVMCESGEEALQKYSIVKPDWVLMDIELKEMSGFVATKEILEQDPSANIIIITSYDTLGFRQRAKSLKVKGFLPKERLSDIGKLLNDTSITNA